MSTAAVTFQQWDDAVAGYLAIRVRSWFKGRWLAAVRSRNALTLKEGRARSASLRNRKSGAVQLWKAAGVAAKVDALRDDQARAAVMKWRSRLSLYEWKASVAKYVLISVCPELCLP